MLLPIHFITPLCLIMKYEADFLKALNILLLTQYFIDGFGDRCTFIVFLLLS